MFVNPTMCHRVVLVSPQIVAWWNMSPPHILAMSSVKGMATRGTRRTGDLPLAK